MPARRKPQISHRSVDYKSVADQFHAELLARKWQILSLVGFFEEFGDPEGPAYSGKDAAAELIGEITGLLTTALTIRVDAGYKAPSKVIATLAAIEGPRAGLIRNDRARGPGSSHRGLSKGR